MTAVGTWLRDCRKERALSQDALGRMVGLDPSAISRIESHQRELTFAEAVAFAQIFDSAPPPFVFVNHEMYERGYRDGVERMSQRIAAFARHTANDLQAAMSA